MKVAIQVDVDVRLARWFRRALLLGVPVAAIAITGSVAVLRRHGGLADDV